MAKTKVPGRPRYDMLFTILISFGLPALVGILIGLVIPLLRLILAF
jgi:hypothetical protein